MKKLQQRQTGMVVSHHQTDSSLMIYSLFTFNLSQQTEYTPATNKPSNLYKKKQLRALVMLFKLGRYYQNMIYIYEGKYLQERVIQQIYN